jgi:hypothetical protein
MRKSLFLSIMHKLSETSMYLTEMHDAIGHIGLTPLQKCITALHQLAYGMIADTIYEYMKLRKSTTLECLEFYCTSIIEWVSLSVTGLSSYVGYYR